MEKFNLLKVVKKNKMKLRKTKYKMSKEAIHYH